MEIDRRELFTGLVATTGVAVLPALPAQAILSGVRRFEFLDGPIFSTLTPPPRGVFSTILLRGLWHFDPDDGENWLIRHVATGLTCRRAPQELDPLALQAVSIDNPLEAWPDAGTVAVIGRAARFVALHTSLVHRWRCYAGAIYLRYTACNPRNPVELPDTRQADWQQAFEAVQSDALAKAGSYEDMTDIRAEFSRLKHEHDEQPDDDKGRLRTREPDRGRLR
jgi:hypothetical protein